MSLSEAVKLNNSSDCIQQLYLENEEIHSVKTLIIFLKLNCPNIDRNCVGSVHVSIYNRGMDMLVGKERGFKSIVEVNNSSFFQLSESLAILCFACGSKGSSISEMVECTHLYLGFLL